MKLSRTVRVAVAISVVAGTVAGLAQIGRAAPADPTAVNAAERLRVPTGYRTLYQTLGSFAITADSGQGSKDTHAVYASPGANDVYREKEHFPDATVPVKEVFATSRDEVTTGAVSHPGTLKSWLVMATDSEGTHPPPLPGDGCGWSCFDADKPLKTASTDDDSDWKDATGP